MSHANVLIKVENNRADHLVSRLDDLNIQSQKRSHNTIVVPLDLSIGDYARACKDESVVIVQDAMRAEAVEAEIVGVTDQ